MTFLFNLGCTFTSSCSSTENEEVTKWSMIPWMFTAIFASIEAIDHSTAQHLTFSKTFVVLQLSHDLKLTICQSTSNAHFCVCCFAAVSGQTSLRFPILVLMLIASDNLSIQYPQQHTANNTSLIWQKLQSLKLLLLCHPKLILSKRKSRHIVL